MKSKPSPQLNWPSVSVLILNWNGRSLLETCLPPLLKQNYPAFEIILIDNASTDDSVPYTRRHFPLVNILQNDENLGFSRGMNAGLRTAGGDLLLLLNNDVIVQPDWLQNLVAPLRADRSIGVAGCKLLFPDGETVQHLGGHLDFPLGYSHHDFVGEPDHGQRTAVTDVPFVTGAAMAITRETIREIGLLDEGFSPFYYEEVDFCTRARNAGWRVVVVPRAAALHDESSSVRQVSGLKMRTLHRSRLRYILKHYTPEQFFHQFIPGETAWLASISDAELLAGLRQAYLSAAAMAPAILSRRQESDRLEQVQQALLQLRSACLTRQTAPLAPMNITDPKAALQQRQEMIDPVFQSTVPLVGPLIAAVRTAWNNVASRWYVRKLMQQQVQFNRLASRMLIAHQEQGTGHGHELDQLLAAQLQLEQRVQQLEKALAGRQPNNLQEASQEHEHG